MNIDSTYINLNCEEFELFHCTNIHGDPLYNGVHFSLYFPRDYAIQGSESTNRLFSTIIVF